MKPFFALLLLAAPYFVTAQRLKKQDKIVIDDLHTEITYLASDKLEGRRTGTPGEKLAYEFIEDQFKMIGLQPKGDDNSFIQPFDVNEGKEILPATHCIINDSNLVLDRDFFPLIFSAAGSVEAFTSPAFAEKGMPWFWDVKDILEQNKNNPHFDIDNEIKNKAVNIATKGATALIVYNSGDGADNIHFNAKDKTDPVKIPVIFITENIAKKYVINNAADFEVNLKVAIADKKRVGHNVIGYINNNAPFTIIIGAHYDHLGYGEDHNSLYTGKAAIHHGADDNASGTAAVIELAKMLTSSKLKNNNYMFICFSGEELGLFGSKYFVEHPHLDMHSINYMLNSDMVGRLNDTTHILTVGGYGTSPAWPVILEQKTKALDVKFDSSGIGPSDHTSFYLKDIPVLFFFTGIHQDYHKPTDEVGKINFKGELQVIKYIYRIIDETNDKGKLAFLKTREPKMEGAHFTVSLGIMPDYSFTGKGVRADGVIDGKIAAKAGIHPGDIITKLGDYTFSDIYAYMDVLAKYKKGDATTVTVQRGSTTLTFNIIF